MSANLDNKKVIVEEIKEKIKNAKTMVAVDYRGINVEQDTALRAEFRKNNADYKVYKNRLVLRALNELGYTGCEKHLEGTTAFAFSYEDELAAPKILKDAVKENCAMQVKFGIYNNEIVDSSVVSKLASIPSRDNLIAMLMSMLQSPVRSLAVVLNEIAAKNA